MFQLKVGDRVIEAKWSATDLGTVVFVYADGGVQVNWDSGGWTTYTPMLAVSMLQLVKQPPEPDDDWIDKLILEDP